MSPKSPLSPAQAIDITIIGCGLIGGSMLRTIRRLQKQAEPTDTTKSKTNPLAIRTVRVFDPNQQTQAQISALDLADAVCPSLAHAAKHIPEQDTIHVIVIATVATKVVDTMLACLPLIATKAIITDVNSTKSTVVSAVVPALPPGVVFVPAHPVAGTESSGFDASLDNLFDNRPAILTPVAGTPKQAVHIIEHLWQHIGAWTTHMTPEHHDRVLAVTSHVPHLVAYAIVGTACELARSIDDEDDANRGNATPDQISRREITEYAAGGFRDFTRIAASDPEMWQAVFLQNREAMLDVLGRLSEDIHHLQRAIRHHDKQTLLNWLTRAREVRRGVIEAGQAGEFYPRHRPSHAPDHDPGDDMIHDKESNRTPTRG